MSEKLLWQPGEAFYFKNIKNIIDKLFVILYNIHVAVSDVT